MRKLEFNVKYIADAIIQVKSERFGETFASFNEVLIIEKLIELRLKENGYDVSFGDVIFSGSFCIDNGVVTKLNNLTCEEEINDKQVRKMIYDKEFIYYCLCQILINKLNNSMEHTCLNCGTVCPGSYLHYSEPRDCNRWTHNFVESCIDNISDNERLLIEASQLQQGSLKKLNYKEQ